MKDLTEYLKKAFEFKNNGDYKKSIDYFYKALALDNESAEIMTELAILYSKLCQYDRAISFYEQIISLNPENFSVQLQYAMLLKTIKEYKHSEEILLNLYDKDLQGFILGSKADNINSPHSTKLFDKFVEFMKKYDIPFSKFKGGLFEHNVAYSSVKDEWLIGNCVMSDGLRQIYKKDPKMLYGRLFDEIEVNDLDEILL